MYAKVSESDNRLFSQLRLAPTIQHKLKAIVDHIESIASSPKSMDDDAFISAHSAARSEYLHSTIAAGDFVGTERILDNLPYQYAVRLRAKLVHLSNANHHEDSANFIASYAFELLNPPVTIAHQVFGERADVYDYPAILSSLTLEGLDVLTRFALIDVCANRFNDLITLINEDLENQSPLTDLDELVYLSSKIPAEFEYLEHQVANIAELVSTIMLDKDKLQSALECSMFWLEDLLFSPTLTEALYYSSGASSVNQMLDNIEEYFIKLEFENNDYQMVQEIQQIRIACNLIRSHPLINPLTDFADQNIYDVDPDTVSSSRANLIEEDNSISKMNHILQTYLRFTKSYGVTSEFHREMFCFYTRNLSARLAAELDDVESSEDFRIPIESSEERIKEIILAENTLLEALEILGDTDAIVDCSQRIEMYLKACQRNFYVYNLHNKDSYEEAFIAAISATQTLSKIGLTDLARRHLVPLIEFARTLGAESDFVRNIQERVMLLIQPVYGNNEIEGYIKDLFRFCDQTESIDSHSKNAYKLHLLSAYATALNASNSSN